MHCFFKKITILVFSLNLFFVFSSCVSIPAPYEEYTLAKVALDAAKQVQAARYSPGNWHQAEDNYKKAVILFEEREYEKALDLFKKARLAAERAENSARLLRQKNGDVL